MTDDVTIIAEMRGRGQYDLPCETRLVERGGKHYLVHGEFRGMHDLRGGQYRPVVYAVPAAMVEEIANRIANFDDFDGRLDDDGEWVSDAWRSPVTHGEALAMTLADLTCYGEQASRPWMAGL